MNYTIEDIDFENNTVTVKHNDAAFPIIIGDVKKVTNFRETCFTIHTLPLPDSSVLEVVIEALDVGNKNGLVTNLNFY